ncbi:MAG: hypothetical protein C0484_21295 [Rhodospirillum sp.]|jgi:hypothetical protein|nr:hypothetical protein [Rhodospirillum sp.]
MTTGSSSTFVAELIQSRNANASEALAIFHAHMKTFRSRMAAVGGSRLNQAALVVAAGVIGAILFIAVESRWVQSLPWIYTASAVVFLAAVAMRVWVHVYYKRCAEVCRESLKANRRFLMEENAFVTINAAGVSTSIPWTAIEDIVDDKNTLTIYLSAAEGIPLPKAACENQNVEDFCRELRRRWRDRRRARA